MHIRTFTIAAQASKLRKQMYARYSQALEDTGDGGDGEDGEGAGTSCQIVASWHVYVLVKHRGQFLAKVMEKTRKSPD